MSALLAKKEDKKAHGDMNKKLGDVSFVGLDATLWPASKELDNMAGELVKAKKNGMPKCSISMFGGTASRHIYSMASWSPNQSEPFTVSYICHSQ